MLSVCCSPGAAMAAGSNVLLGNLGVHVDITLASTTSLYMVRDHIHTFMADVFPNNNGLFKQGNAYCYRLFRNRLRNITKCSLSVFIISYY